MMSKVANAKKTPATKMEKLQNVLRSKTTNRHTAFKNSDSRQVFYIQMFLHQGWYLHKERETSFLTLCMVNFDLTATSLFKL